MSPKANFRAGILAICAAVGMSACASSGDAVSKVKIFRLDPGHRLNAAGDPAIGFEYRHRLHGAISNEEFTNRTGNYYTTFFSVADRSQPVTVRFEYRQTNTGSKVRTQEQIVEAPKGSNVTEFRVTGSDFLEGGSVIGWRVSLVRGKEILATRKSYLWD